MHQGSHQSHPLTLTAGEGAYLLGKVRKAQTGQHGFCFVFIQFPEFFGKMQEDLLQNGSVVFHKGVLGQVADLGVGTADDLAFVGFQGAGQNLQKGGFAGAVDADDTDFVAFI